MKKSTSITFEQNTLDTMNEMCAKNTLNPSLSQMAENLITTNPAFMDYQMGQRRKQKLSTKK